MFKIQHLFFFTAAFLSFLLSNALWFGFFGEPDRIAGIYVGIWVPSNLGVAIFLQLVSRGGR